MARSVFQIGIHLLWKSAVLGVSLSVIAQEPLTGDSHLYDPPAGLRSSPLRCTGGVHTRVFCHPLGTAWNSPVTERVNNVTIFFKNKIKVLDESEGASRQLHPTLCHPGWTAAPQAPLSVTFPRQEHGSGLPFPSIDLSCTVLVVTAA